jgi:hypothetical protein
MESLLLRFILLNVLAETKNYDLSQLLNSYFLLMTIYQNYIVSYLAMDYGFMGQDIISK